MATNTGGALYFEGGIDPKKLYDEIARINSQLKGMADNTVKQGSRMDVVLRDIGIGMAGYFSISAMGNFAKEIAHVRGEFQQLGISFETMLKSKSAADELLAQTTEFAATTPYELRDVGNGVKKLLAFNVEAKDTIGTLRMLGDISAGLGTDLDGLVQAYGKVKAKGKLQAEEMNLFLERGIPLVRELAKMYDVAESEVYNMASAGKVGFSDLEKVLSSLTSAGGMFEGMMEKQSKSITGQLSNLADSYSQMLNKIGKDNEGLIYDLISGANTLVQNYEAIEEVLKALIVVFGAYKVAVMLVRREMEIQAATALLVKESNDFLVASEARAIVMKERSLAAQKRLNESMLANPWVLAATAVAALSYAIYKLATYQTELEKSISKTNIEIENEKDKASQLFAVLKNAKEGTEQWENAKKKIIDQYGSYLTPQEQELKNLNGIAEAQEKVNKALRENGAIKGRDELLKSVGETYNTALVNSKEKAINAINSALGTDASYGASMKLDDLTAMFNMGDGAMRDIALAKIHEFGRRIKEEISANTTFGFDEGRFNDAFNAYVTFLTGKEKELAKINEAYNKEFGNLGNAPEGQKGLKEAEESIETVGDRIKALSDKISELQAKRQKLAATDVKGREELDSLIAKYNREKSALEGKDLKDEKLKAQVGSYAELEEKIKKYTELVQTSNLEQRPFFEEQLNYLERIKKSWDEAIEWNKTPLQAKTKEKIGKVDYSGKKVDKSSGLASTVYQDALLNSILAKTQEEIKTANADALAEGLFRASDAGQELVRFAGALNEDLAKGIEFVSEMSNGIGNLVKGFSTKDPFQIIAGTAQIGESIAKAIGGVSEYEKTLMRINALIELQNFQWERQKGVIDELVGIDKINETTKAILENELALKELQKTMDKGSFAAIAHTFNKMGVTAKGNIESYKDAWEKIIELEGSGLKIEGKEAIKKIIDQYDDLIAKRKELSLANEQALTGTNFSELTDKMSEMFDSGKDSAVDFANSLENNLKRALVNAFKQQFLMAQLDKLNKDLAIAIGDDNGLTDQEMKIYSDGYKQIFDNAKNQWEVMKNSFSDLFDSSFDSETSLAGQVQRSITQETASELVGLWNRTSLDIRSNLDTTKIAVNHLVKIEANTYRTANNTEHLSRLANMENSLKNLESTFNRIPSIRDLGN